MRSINQQVLENLIRLLVYFIERKINPLSTKERSVSELVHYYSEIIRNWNKINFIFLRKLKSTKKIVIFGNYSIAKFYIAIYRIIWEKENVLKVGTELNFPPRTIDLLKNLSSFSWNKELSGLYDTEKLSLQLAVPSFMISKLIDVLDFDSIRANINYMDRQGDHPIFYFRINNLVLNETQKNKVDSILTELRKQGIKVKQDEHFSELFITNSKNKKKLISSSFYNENEIVILDKASYTVAHLLNPRPNELVFDMCAAPGIKTSMTALLSQNKSIIIANDFNLSRVYAMSRVLNNLSVGNTHLINSDSIAFPFRFNNFFDKILLDAPCTGSGTFSTNPEIKWRQNEGFLHQNITLQKKLLKSAIDLLKPSGILVYSTCSLYPEEGENQIRDVLDELKPMDLPKWIAPSYKINGKSLPGTGRLIPPIHKTKGFFIAKFKKK
ncbi:MAG: RsmB/NOP family class I SAM-dependent RNA methyltransferase [Candidatus Hermodarchaeota archaeon]